MLRQRIQRMLSKLANEGYTFEKDEDESGRLYLVARADVRIGDGKYPCDTGIDIDPDNITGTSKITFTTFITDGAAGREEEKFYKVVTLLNYYYPGKFVCDYTDSSADVLYVTTDRLDDVTVGNFIENLDHHAQVKAQVTPELERLKSDLNLESKTKFNHAEQYALDWRASLQNVLLGDNITYLTSEEEK